MNIEVLRILSIAAIILPHEWTSSISTSPESVSTPFHIEIRMMYVVTDC